MIPNKCAQSEVPSQKLGLSNQNKKLLICRLSPKKDKNLKKVTGPNKNK